MDPENESRDNIVHTEHAQDTEAEGAETSGAGRHLGTSDSGSSAGAAPAMRPDAWALIQRLVSRSLDYKAMLSLAFVSGVLVTLVRYSRAYLFKPLMDDVLVPASSAGVHFDTVEPVLWELGLLLGLTLVVQPAAVFVRSYSAHWVVARVRQGVDREVAAKFLAAPLRVHRQGSSGDYMSRALTDARLACNGIEVVYNEALIHLQMAIGGAFALFMASWQLAALTLVAMPPFFILLAIFGRRIQKQTHRRQESQGDLSQRLISILSGIKVIKAFQGQALESDAFAVETGKYFRRHMKVIWNGVLAKATGELMNPLVGFAVLGFGTWLLLNGLWGITLGTLVQFALILVTVYKPIKALTQSYPRMMESTGGAARLFSVLDMEREPDDRENAQQMPGISREICFRDVHFEYPNRTPFGESPPEPVLRGIDLEIRKGEVVAFVGRTGTGKSTLVDLVLRFHDPTRGAIEIDGTDLRDFRRDSFLQHIALVTQEPFLFDTTILENIRYAKPDATQNEVEAAAAAASADEFIRTLPDGYETEVGEGGLRLSGGQRQRLTIARAILADPHLLVFDEATSALDAKTERAVQDAINALRGERTILLVAHRLSTIRNADRIIVLEDGRVAQQGDHETLMQEDGLYRDLVGVQDPEWGDESPPAPTSSL